MQAILLAAGFGTRLQPYTNMRPKPLFPVLNQPLLYRLLEQLRQCECRSVVVNCHHLASQIEAVLKDYPKVGLQYEPEILGTGGTLRQALDSLDDEPVLVVNGDLYHQINLEQVYHQHLLSKHDVTLALHDYPRFNQVAVEDNLVRRFGSSSVGSLAFTGIHVVDPEAIERIPAKGFYHIIDLYKQLAEEGRVGFCRVDGALWRDIGTPVDYLQLHGELLQGQTQWLIDPQAQVGADVVLEGWGCIGPQAEIGAGSRLSCCVVWDEAKVPAGSCQSDTILTGDQSLDNQSGESR